MNLICWCAFGFFVYLIPQLAKSKKIFQTNTDGCTKIMWYLLCVERCVSYTLGIIIRDFFFFLNMNIRIVIAVWTAALTDIYVYVSNFKVTLKYTVCIVQFILLGGYLSEAPKYSHYSKWTWCCASVEVLTAV
jgi:hypothetical protein